MAYNTEWVWRDKLNHSEMFMVCFIAMDISGIHLQLAVILFAHWVQDF